MTVHTMSLLRMNYSIYHKYNLMIKYSLIFQPLSEFIRLNSQSKINSHMNILKTSLKATAIVAFLFASTNLLAQEKKASPAATVSATVNGANITINYSRPSAKGRTIMGSLVPYGKVWRTGANEATTFEVSKNVKIEGQTLKAGKYALFTVPGEKSWKIIFNSTAKQWGAYDYDEGLDVLSIDVDVTEGSFAEMFTIEAGSNGAVSLAWDKTKVQFSVK